MIEELNKKLSQKSPEEIVNWAIGEKENTIITTNFRPYEVAILHLVCSVKPNIPVVWCDTGYNTSYTYKHAEDVIERLSLNIDLFVPKQSTAHRNVLMGIPGVDDPKHALFSEQVKLEPFGRAMAKHKPELWFTNLRKGQTDLRNKLDILSVGRENEWKVSPFYNFSDEDLDEYLKKHNLPNEKRYYDPTKALDNRECGIHTN